MQWLCRIAPHPVGDGDRLTPQQQLYQICQGEHGAHSWQWRRDWCMGGMAVMTMVIWVPRHAGTFPNSRCVMFERHLLLGFIV